jgi:phage replication initiation protein
MVLKIWELYRGCKLHKYAVSCLYEQFQGGEDMEITIDYLQFNIGKEMVENEIINNVLFLGDREFTNIRGQLGYKECMIYKDVRLFFNGTENMGKLIQMSGHGCRTMETIINFDWYNYINYIYENKYKFSRVDIAIDCFDNELDLNIIHKEIQKGNLITYCKTYDRRNELKIKDNSVLTDTLYIGKRTSDIYFRIYDKKLERISKGMEVKEKSWIRFEVVMKHHNAEKFIEYYCNSGDMEYLIKGVINNYVKFVKDDNNKNVSRKNKIEWWEKFMQTALKLKLLRVKNIQI